MGSKGSWLPCDLRTGLLVDPRWSGHGLREDYEGHNFDLAGGAVDAHTSFTIWACVQFLGPSCASCKPSARVA